MNDFAVLAQLDLMRMRNTIRGVMRSPGRAAVWLLYIIWFGAVIVLRFVKNTYPSPKDAGHFGIGEPVASIVAFGFIFACAFMLLRAGGGAVGAFASKADARFLTSSHLNPRHVAIWLQLRNSFGSILRFLYLIILYTMIFNTAGTMSGMTFSMAFGAAFAGSLAIPGLAASKRFGSAFAGVVTSVAILAAVAALGLALAFVRGRPQLVAIPLSLEHLRLGAVVSAMLSGGTGPLLALFLATVALIVAAYFCALDLYPELYEASLSSFQRASRRRGFGRGRITEQYQVRNVGATRTVLSGGWMIIWKEWLGFRRGRNARITIAASVFFILGAGVAGRVLETKTTEPLLFGLAGPAVTLAILLITMTAISLASDLRKPIWWLGPDALRIRLYAWVVSITWRMSTVVFFAASAYALMAGKIGFIPWLLVLAVLMPLMLRAVSLATYAILPAPADQRGPLAMLRVFITLTLFLPPAIVYLAALFLFHNVAGELFSLLLVCVLQIGALIEFASWRMNGTGSSFALAEQSA
ncbi:MAG: putative ABC exporter domain-containing protein [Candidatus Baltobacteraceae bacterium]